MVNPTGKLLHSELLHVHGKLLHGHNEPHGEWEAEPGAARGVEDVEAAIAVGARVAEEEVAQRGQGGSAARSGPKRAAMVDSGWIRGGILELAMATGVAGVVDQGWRRTDPGRGRAAHYGMAVAGAGVGPWRE
jgi:hypothetical protein